MSFDLHWIGIAEEYYRAEGFQPGKEIVSAFFACSVRLKKAEKRVPAAITGRSQYKLFVNGKPVIFGPLRGPRYYAYVDETDLAPYLEEGDNHLLIQVMSYPGKPSARKYEGPSNAFADDGGPAIAVSGIIGDTDLSDNANWTCWFDRSMGYNDYELFLAGPTEFVDFSRYVPDPQLIHPVSDLEPAAYTITGERLGRSFEKRPIPYLYRKERVFSDFDFGADSSLHQESVRVIPKETTASFVLDAGELTTAYFRAGISGGKGSAVRFTYAECYFTELGPMKALKSPKGYRDDPSGVLDGVFDEIRPDGEERIYEPFRFRTFRFVNVEIETKEEALTLRILPFVETAYPLENKKRPAFTDPKMEKLYDVALRTLQLCMHDTYEDCPYYEQLMYASDSRLEMLFTYKCSGDTRLAEYAIGLFASSLLPEGFIQSRFPSEKLQIIPGFSLYFIMMLEDYINETGCPEKMAPYIPAAEKIIETFLSKRTESGMIAPQGYWEYYDWTIQWDGHRGVPNGILSGESTLENLLFVCGCQSLIRILPLFHRSELAAHYSGECEKLLKLIREREFDPERGLLKEAADLPEYSQHSQIFGVLTGLFEGEEAKEVMEKVLTDDSLILCSFVQRFYLFRALEKAGIYDRTEALWADWQHMIDLHCTTFPETPYMPRSECHGWSALPLYEFA